MSVIAFWNGGKEQTGKTLSMVAIATYLAVEHNRRILVISTGFEDETLNRCFWEEKRSKRNLGLFGPNTNAEMQEGVSGLARMIKSNKISPENITNYTKIIFTDRLEVLKIFKGSKSEYEEIKSIYPDIIALANNYYDLVLVDVDNELGAGIVEKILDNANLVVASISQRLLTINNFIELREKMPVLKSKKTLLLVGRYDKFSKYTIKNISRYMGEKNKVSTIPYNTLFFEACEEARVPDYFSKFRSIDEDDRNGFFLAEVRRASDNIIYRLQNIEYRV